MECFEYIVESFEFVVAQYFEVVGSFWIFLICAKANEPSEEKGTEISVLIVKKVIYDKGNQKSAI